MTPHAASSASNYASNEMDDARSHQGRDKQNPGGCDDHER